MADTKTKVAIFIPCLIDQVMPEIGFAMADVLRKLDCSVEYNPQQTCCGQPAFNAGQRIEAKRVARHFIETFSDAEVVVSPSGSCTAMVRKFFPILFENDEVLLQEVKSLQKKTVEISEFICHENRLKKIKGQSRKCIAIHNSCHSMRELGITNQIERIVAHIDGVKIIPPNAEHSCCGFGGLFSFKMPDIAVAMAKTRLDAFADPDLDIVISNDPGCIQHLRAEAVAIGFKPRILHLVEFLQAEMK
ncbi:MAG: (Fe-S)-binding protein [Calditrichaeota bacterium]|nr:MAG: (Fe-S)-binding protein [Calditrichota bacterium]